MTDRLAIGVDVGGTKIAFALVSAQGEVLVTHRLPTRPGDGPEALLDRIAQGIERVLAQTDLSVMGVGIGCPGHVNPDTGIVRNAVNLGWTEVAVRTGLHRRLASGLPIRLHKDANASALGEMYFGAAQGCQDFVYFAVGTGLGGAAVVGGRVVLGANAYAMEIGHLVLDPQGRRCRCGMQGCAEMYVSGLGLLAGVQAHQADYPDSPLAHTAQPSTEAILEAARANDALARTVMAAAGRWLGAVMACCASLFNPALFVIGGGLGRAAADLWLPEARQELNRRVLPATSEKLQIVESQVTSSAIGAACLVWHDLRAGHVQN